MDMKRGSGNYFFLLIVYTYDKIRFEGTNYF